MSIAPIITFKAGLCDIDLSSSPPKVTPRPTPGYIYLYVEDEILHLSWRPRNTPLDNPELDLLMFPTDCTFTPYRATSAENPNNSKRPTNGRIYILKFSSSPVRHLFWLQSKSQAPDGNPSWFSARDLKLGEIVNTLLQGEDVDVSDEMNNLPSGQGPEGDDDETMEDVEGTNNDSEHHRGGSGGAGPDATGGDVREEGEQSREGGADGGRAAAAGGSMDANTIIQNFIKSMGSSSGNTGGAQQAQGKLFTTLQDLLTTNHTIPWIDSIDEAKADSLLQFLPPQLIDLARQADSDPMITTTTQDTSPPDSTPLTFNQKKSILNRVLRSPQFTQSLASLTIALRDGGLPSLSEALNIPVHNGGYMRRGGVPLGGGEAVEGFLNGVRTLVSKEASGEKRKRDGGEGGDDDDEEMAV